jgi:predicted DNA-binding transcriptional regulator AlpA
MPTENPPSKYVTAAQVRARYNVSNMWLHRRVKAGDFPAPVRLNKSADPDQAMRHWLVADLDAWDAA